jgi:hypothetical protein
LPDFDAIATAIAARYAPGQVTPPTGYANIRTSTADAPGNIVAPCVIVFPEAGTFEPGSGTRIGPSDFLVRFYFEKAADLPRQLTALRKWLTVLVDQHLLSVQLGGTVASCRTMRWSVGLLEYGDQPYAGIELGVHVVTSEAWSPTA